MTETRGLLDLIIARLPAFSSRERARLAMRFSNEAELCSLGMEGIIEAAKTDEERRQGVLDFDEEETPEKKRANLDDVRREAERDFKVMRALGIGCISIAESAYPALLKEIYDPPAALYFRGRLPSDTFPRLAVVGTRKPRSRSLDWTYRFGASLGGAGVSVVSGLALGIDAMAHRGNVDGGGATVAVLGSGADMVYPPSNRHLAGRILESGGALLSEYPPGTRPFKWHFPARNRLISGLSPATLVVEAGAKSGALITADFALEQGRDLWVASDEAEGFFGEGCGRLTIDGARRIYSAQDIFKEWNIESGRTDEAGGTALAEKLAKELGI